MSPSKGTVSGSCGGVNNATGRNYIEHQISKFDTLAGVAIKYGVEVADIKRLNGLATDLQMFALKTLQIPLPGRHPPSPSLSNGSASVSLRENNIEKTPPFVSHFSLLDSVQPPRPKSMRQDASSAMSDLQKYYGLKSLSHNGLSEGTEMSVYRTASAACIDDGLLLKASPVSITPSDHYHKSKNSGNNGSLPENGMIADLISFVDAADGEGEKSNENSVRRRQKAEADTKVGTPEKVLKEENGGGSSGFSPLTGKGLAMRPKSASRSVLTSDSESGWLNTIAVSMGESIIAAGLDGVRKSSSASSLQDHDNGSLSSLWQTSKWSLKPESTSSITSSLFDGLPKPITGRRSKAALD